jgi:long-subunit fatty acid transport protein
MKRELTVGVGLCILSIGSATAGGLLLPGSGAISTSRAGAAIASADDGEALSLNPAGLAKAPPGTTLTVSAAIIDYSMQFTRRGTYDTISEEDTPYEGQPYPTVTNNAKPPLGFGSFQPVPVVAIVSDLGGAVKGLHVALGIFAPNAYPFRDMTNGYCDPKADLTSCGANANFSKAPPPSRYDILTQEAAVILPSLAASYRINDQLDIGGRFSVGFATLSSTTMIWGVPANTEEFVKKDGVFHVEAKDNLVTAFGFGMTYRPTPSLELAATYNSQINLHAKGDATSNNGPGVNLNMQPIVTRPTPDEAVRCATGGTNDAQKVCVGLALPMSATLGGRYKFLDGNGKLAGDLELNVGWENWGGVSRYSVVSDTDVYIVNSAGQESYVLTLRENAVEHGFKDVFTARLGGSYHIPSGDNEIIVRGGVGMDTAAAREGWLRSDIDGAARETFAIGGAYRTKRFEINAGFGYIFEGSPSNPGTCNPTSMSLGCRGDGTENPVTEPPTRKGPDPILPIVGAEQQQENPVTQGDYKSHYILIMLGVSTWF